MSRGARLAAAVGVLLAVVLSASTWLPASGNGFEGTESRVNVVPSDDLPPGSTVKVSGEGFYPGSTLQVNEVQVAQCYPPLEACGQPMPMNVPDGATFSGDFNVFRFLSLQATTIDCADPRTPCVVQVTGGGFGTHHLTFSQADPTTTTIKPPVTTSTTIRVTIPTTSTSRPSPTTTTTRPPQPGVTIPPTTRVRVAPTTTTVAPTTTSTTVPAPTTTLPPPPGDGPSLIAVTSRNESSGPPGGGLHVEGSGYSCPTVYFFFDGTRVGSASPDATGHVSKGGLSVPGDTGRGPRRVTSSCEASGDVVEQSAAFEVLPVSVHRPAFVTSLSLPDQVTLAPGQLLASAAVAMGAIMLIAFPYELFNSTMEENYDEIRGWFGLGPRGVPEVRTRSRLLSFLGLTALSAATCGFLSPDFGWNPTSGVLFVGMFVALIVMAVVFSVPADIGIHRQVGEWGTPNFLPGSVIVSIVLVLLSRVLDFQPGYFYGALAGLAFRSALSERVQGKMTAANWVFSLTVSVGAFFLRAPVAAAAAEPGSSVWWIGLEVCLALIFLWGVEGLAVAMLPMKFLDGRKVFRWSKTAWAALFFLGVFATVHVLLRPGSGYVGKTNGEVSVGVMSLFALFGLASIGLWAYFRFRPDRWVPAPART